MKGSEWVALNMRNVRRDEQSSGLIVLLEVVGRHAADEGLWLEGSGHGAG